MENSVVCYYFFGFTSLPAYSGVGRGKLCCDSQYLSFCPIFEILFVEGWNSTLCFALFPKREKKFSANYL